MLNIFSGASQLGLKEQQVQQSPASLVLQEGENAELQCNFSSTATQLQWFYQSPGGSLVSLLSNPSGTKHTGRLTSTTVTKERRSSLHISSSQTTDSGTYLCAMEPQCSPHTCSPHTNLQLGGRGPLQSQDIRKPPQNICVAYCLFLVWVEFHPWVSFGPCRFTFAFIFISQYILPPEIAVFNSELTEADGMTEST